MAAGGFEQLELRQVSVRRVSNEVEYQLDNVGFGEHQPVRFSVAPEAIIVSSLGQRRLHVECELHREPLLRRQIGPDVATQLPEEPAHVQIDCWFLIDAARAARFRRH